MVPQSPLVQLCLNTHDKPKYLQLCINCDAFRSPHYYVFADAVASPGSG